MLPIALIVSLKDWDTQMQYVKDWETKKLGELAKYINGYPFKPSDWKQHGLPIVRIEQINNPSANYDYYIGSVPLDNYIDNGDLLFSWSATLSVLIWKHGPAILNQHIFKVIPNDSTHASFLYHLLQSLLDKLAAHSHGSTMKHIKRSDFLPFPISLPIFDEQQRIAEILDTADEAIRKTEQIIAKLKLVKAGLLHDLLTRGLDEEGQLRDPVAHSEQFKDSPLGKIPQEWEIVNFEKIAEAIDPQPDHRAPAEVLGGEPYVGIGDFQEDGRINFDRCRKVSKQALMKQQQRFQIEEGDILFGKIGTIGLPRLLPSFIQRPYALNANTILIKPKILKSFVLWCLRSIHIEKQIEAQTTLTSQPAFGIQKVRTLLIPLPTEKEQVKLANLLDSQEKKLQAEENYLVKLKQLKQGLMEDLLTGKVRTVPTINTTGR